MSQSPRPSPEGKCRASVWGRRERPHLCSDQGLEAGLEVVESAVVEPRHLVQELLVLGLEVVPHGPELFPGLGNETLAVTAITGLSSAPDGSSTHTHEGGIRTPGVWSHGHQLGPQMKEELPCVTCAPLPTRAPLLGTWWSLASTGPVFSFSSYFSTLACSLL